jgi:GTP:adenosylcobinamide-phosphate guanylyltransferase
MVNAAILGGGNVDTRLEGVVTAPTKALFAVAGKPCLQYVIEALRATPQVERVALVGSSALAELPAAKQTDAQIWDGPSSITDKLLAAVEALGEERKLLVVNADAPLLTAENLGDVIDHCTEDLGLLYPVVEKAEVFRHFPERHWYPVKLRALEIVCTNVFILDPRVVKDRVDLLRAVEAVRWNPWGLARILGLGFALRLKLGWLSLEQAERRLSQLVGAPCRAMVSGYPEIAMDLDDPGDERLIERWLQTRQGGASEAC